MRLAAMLLFVGLIWTACSKDQERQTASYAGSTSCQECHEGFYKLWSTSMHGLAMQMYSPAFSKARLTLQQNEVAIGNLTYRADIGAGVVIETGPDEKNRYPIKYVMGGKNVYYFLTPLDRGRLQTLPIAYDVHEKAWFDTAASGMRHFPGGSRSEGVNWKESPYTFNTSCYSCHVSQLSTNYDQKNDAYHTTWSEPGINCETCHGPGGEHIKIAKATPKGQPFPELGLISALAMTKSERNDLCSDCHAKAIPLTSGYKPKERFFDHFDLVLLESSDYYPDGRDLGENYTVTSWLMSQCVKSGQLDCMHCHTSSGRYRFNQVANANDACLPCHEDRVKNATAHTHHREGSKGNLCISCHMPMTTFARMRRTDHAMLPPAPVATIKFESPNACNLCHADKNAKWADKYVRKWSGRDYQAPVLKRASLIDAARKRDWSRLPEMLDYIKGKDSDEVFAASLIRLLMNNQDERITPVLLTAMTNPSPLVQSSAVQALAMRPSGKAVQVLLDATGSEYRIVRIHAAAGLAGFPLDRLRGAVKDRVEKANREYLAFIMARPDQWTSHYNMGNYQLSRGELKEAAASYQTALKLEPDAVLATVNLSIAYARMGKNDEAENFLQSALKTAPDSAPANLNMGLLKAERHEPQQAEEYLRKAIKADPQMAQAAYNLCIITSKNSLDEGISWCREATKLRPQSPRYAFTLAFYLNQKGERAESVRTLKEILKTDPEYQDAAMLLQEISGKHPDQRRK